VQKLLKKESGVNPEQPPLLLGGRNHKGHPLTIPHHFLIKVVWDGEGGRFGIRMKSSQETYPKNNPSEGR